MRDSAFGLGGGGWGAEVLCTYQWRNVNLCVRLQNMVRGPLVSSISQIFIGPKENWAFQKDLEPPTPLREPIPLETLMDGGQRHNFMVGSTTSK